MRLTHCLKCKYHQEVKVDGTPFSPCTKENCLAIYSDCITEVAMVHFLEQNRLPHLRKTDSALEVCYRTL